MIRPQSDSAWRVCVLQQSEAETNVYTTLSAQIAVAKQIDLIANNIANVTTTGYKAERPIFEKALQQQSLLLSSSLKKDVTPPDHFATNDFAAMKSSYADLSNGATENTGSPLDVTINGPGFFVVQTPAGERYTRAGSFKMDSSNRLVTQDGNPVMGQGGELVLKQGEIAVSSDGNITVDKQSFGSIRVVDLKGTTFNREAGTLFAVTSGSPTEIEKPSVISGALEGSNVNAVRELADMILASRLFEGLKNVQDSEARLDQARNEKLGSTQG
jgi:flagellar basal-body rod protein FlgF